MNHIDRWCFLLPIILGFSSWNQSWYVAFAFAVCAWLLKKVLRRYRSLFGRRFWGLNFGRRTGPYKMASTVPCLHGAVELLLTGGQHKPCASFNQQACRNTTSVAEGKRKTPQKIASKGAKIFKKCPHFGVQNWTRFGVCIIHFLNNSANKQTPKTGPFLDPKMVAFFWIFLRLLMQFFAGFSVCLLIRMLYSYTPVDWNWRTACVGRPSITIQRPRAGTAQGRPMKAAWFDALLFDPRFGSQNRLSCGGTLERGWKLQTQRRPNLSRERLPPAAMWVADANWTIGQKRPARPPDDSL